MGFPSVRGSGRFAVPRARAIPFFDMFVRAIGRRAVGCHLAVPSERFELSDTCSSGGCIEWWVQSFGGWVDNGVVII